MQVYLYFYQTGSGKDTIYHWFHADRRGFGDSKKGGFHGPKNWGAHNRCRYYWRTLSISFANKSTGCITAGYGSSNVCRRSVSFLIQIVVHCACPKFRKLFLYSPTLTYLKRVAARPKYHPNITLNLSINTVFTFIAERSGLRPNACWS